MVSVGVVKGVDVTVVSVVATGVLTVVGDAVVNVVGVVVVSAQIQNNMQFQSNNCVICNSTVRQTPKSSIYTFNVLSI